MQLSHNDSHASYETSLLPGIKNQSSYKNFSKPVHGNARESPYNLQVRLSVIKGPVAAKALQRHQSQDNGPTVKNILVQQ